MSTDSNSIKHIRVYKWLKGMVETNKFDEVTQLPTEQEIVKMFGYSRMTVRKAMEMLVSDGLIVRSRRKGTFLAPDYTNSFNYSLDNIVSFRDMASARNMVPTYYVFDKRIVEAPPLVIRDLQLPPKASAIVTGRVINANGMPVMIEKSFFPYPEFVDMLDMDFTKSIRYPDLMDKCKVHFEKAKQTLYAGLLDEKEKELLGYESDQEIPCIRQRNILTSSDGAPVFAFYAAFPGDKFRFTVSSDGYKPELFSEK